jgi:TetR/AcrR family transcriptional regulator, tetracycline repressor protein
MSTSERPRHRGAGQRAGLSRELVLAAARRIADAEGVDHLTMRRLAAELGVLPNALYTYVPDKEALLDALIDDLLADIEADGPATGDWRDGLVRVMDSSRRLLLAHPQLVPVFLARPGLGPNAARLGEITFGLLRRGGLEGERAVEAFRALLIYSLGFAAFQARRLPEEAGARSARAEAAFASLPADGFPEMRRLARHLASPATDHQFHTGLRWLLDGIAAQSGQAG